MKAITLIIIFFASFVGLYLLFSTLGMLFDQSYHEVVSSGQWITMYSLFLGWLSFLPCREYYMQHQSYFDEVF